MRLSTCLLFITSSVLSVAALCSLSCAQTSSTGSLKGATFDTSGAILQGAALSVLNLDTGGLLETVSDDKGRFAFLLLPPGDYQLCATKTHFAQICASPIEIHVAEVRNVDVKLNIATATHQIQVLAPIVRGDSSSLGRVVDTNAVISLPLATRNFAQIASLSPGVITGVSNAGELGLGGTAVSQINNSSDGLFVHGLRSYDNNWQLDGVSVNDVHGNGSGSGGTLIPSPDSIQEFNVQTALYDAGYGRYAGANVSIVTKSGGASYHGTVFEFFRNDVLNANDFFRNQAQQPRPVLKQNQFGFAFGGPIREDRLFFFSSYQGTRQVNGLAAGQARVACSASLSEPPLTADRSPAALGELFAGMTGALGGAAVKSDGSNINPAALALLNFKLSDGSFLIPTPQTTNSSKPLASQGFSSFSQPCRFNENQFSTNIDYVPSQKSKITGHFFFADDDRTVAFPGNFFNPSANIRGFTSPSDVGYGLLSFAHTYTVNKSTLNEARIGYVHTASDTTSRAPFTWSDIGVAEGEMSEANELPNLNIVGSVAFASAFPYSFAQNSVVLSDIFSFAHGAHVVRLGGSLTRLHDDFRDPGIGSFVQFLSWPDFLLGLDAMANGTNGFSNVFASIDDFGLFDREYRIWEGSAFVQDDYRIRKSLTLNLGLRYERLGQFADRLGRNSSFDIRNADPNPPLEGSVAGYVVASNFRGNVPSGVQQTHNVFANNGAGQNTVAPRLGLAWRVLPNTDRLVLRAGYGIYFSRPTGQAFFQNSAGAPFANLRFITGPENAGATFQAPFPTPFPTADSFPLFPAYSPDTAISVFTTSPDFRPALVQQYSLNLQAEFARDWVLETAYVGTHGTNLQRLRSLNQASLASSDNPIRCATTNTVANLPLRVPIRGIEADSLQEVETAGVSWYNALEVSMAKRLSHGFQFLAAYTFSKTLDTDGADINGTSAGIVLTLGNQNSARQRWGRTSFDRTHRFVISTTWSPSPPLRGLAKRILEKWTLGAISTIQSGTALTVSYTNSTSVLGISEDRAQLAGNCSTMQLVTGGSVESKLNHYFNSNCFALPHVIGADGIGTDFGNSSTGIVNGPGQVNLDLAVSRTFSCAWLRDKSALTFRAEFYNALNHPQFANPDSNFSSPTFGVISATNVNPRVIQFALKLAF